MRLISNQIRFELNLLGFEGGEDAGLQWLVVKVAIDSGEKKYSQTGAWLTTDEWKNLGEFFIRISRGSQDSEIEFMEPNIRLEYKASVNEIKIYLSQEARPPWLDPETGLAFVCSPEQCALLGGELLLELQELSGKQAR